MLMSVQLCACSEGILDRVLTTPFTGTLIRRMATAVASGTEAAMVMITDFSHERNVEVDVSHLQALVCVTSNLFVHGEA